MCLLQVCARHAGARGEERMRGRACCRCGGRRGGGAGAGEAAAGGGARRPLLLGGALLLYCGAGAALFRAVEGPPPPAAAGALRARCVERLWALTEDLNILYRDNWTALAALELAEFQRLLLTSLRAPPPDPLPWTFAGRFLYALTLVTTIGEILPLITQLVGTSIMRETLLHQSSIKKSNCFKRPP